MGGRGFGDRHRCVGLGIPGRLLCRRSRSQVERGFSRRDSPKQRAEACEFKTSSPSTVHSERPGAVAKSAIRHRMALLESHLAPNHDPCVGGDCAGRQFQDEVTRKGARQTLSSKTITHTGRATVHNSGPGDTAGDGLFHPARETDIHPGPGDCVLHNGRGAGHLLQAKLNSNEHDTAELATTTAAQRYLPRHAVDMMNSDGGGAAVRRGLRPRAGQLMTSVWS